MSEQEIMCKEGTRKLPWSSIPCSKSHSSRSYISPPTIHTVIMCQPTTPPHSSNKGGSGRHSVVGHVLDRLERDLLHPTTLPFCSCVL